MYASLMCLRARDDKTNMLEAVMLIFVELLFKVWLAKVFFRTKIFFLLLYHLNYSYGYCRHFLFFLGLLLL